MVMPFSSNLIKYLSDTSTKNPTTTESISTNEKRSSFYSSYENSGSFGSLATSNPSNSSSFEVISASAVMWYDQPLLSEREAIKILAQCSLHGEIECKTLTVDPNITSFSSLFILLKKAFSLNNDFDISYLLPKKTKTSRPDVYLSLTSDWDLDAAFHTASYPVMHIKVMPEAKGDVTDWAVLEDKYVVPQVQDIKSINYSPLPSIHSIKTHFSKQINKVFDVFESVQQKRVPLMPKDWAEFFDPNGRVISADEMRVRIFNSGLDASVRKKAWVHLLGVYPSDLSVEERTRFLIMKGRVYNHLKETWLNKRPQDIEDVTHMVQKDVLRTDRMHSFFNVPEDHPNIVSLFNILTTFALNNPDVSYCQGMSDLAAPLLVITQDETMAYLCFCKVMDRLRRNFMLKGNALLHKFGQLSLLLQRTDEKLFKYLQEIEGGNLYFCYRMLLLELKREFPFDEALSVMETIWSSVPPDVEDLDSELAFYSSILHGADSRHHNDSDAVNSAHHEGLYKPNYFIYDRHGGEENEVRLDPLPHPRYLNDGSPYPLFLCLAVLLINSDNIINEEMDYAMLAMFFDKMSRKHDSAKVLNRAKSLFYEYIRAYLDGQTVDPKDGEQHNLEGAHGTQSTAAQC